VLETDARVERVDGDNGELMVTLRDPTQHHSFLIEALVASKIQLHSIAPTSSSWRTSSCA